MLTLKNNYLPNAYGLRNSSCICYFNSFIQALTTCTALNEYVLENRNHYMTHPVLRYYVELLDRILNTTKTIFDIFKIQEEFTKYLRETAVKKGNARDKFGIGQEDAQEGMLYFLELFGDVTIKLLNTRNTEIQYCSVCNKNTNLLSQERYMKEHSFFMRITPDRFADINKDIDNLKHFREYVSDYICDRCHTKGSSTILTCVSRVSSILIIAIDRYISRDSITLPDTLSFDNVEGNTLTYKLIATIEHFGGLNGGHYVAQVLRKDVTCIANDSHIQDINHIRSTNNTYLLFYHLLPFSPSLRSD